MNALEQAEDLRGSSLPCPDAIARLGQGWIAEEALVVSVYRALKAGELYDFREGGIGESSQDRALNQRIWKKCPGDQDRFVRYMRPRVPQLANHKAGLRPANAYDGSAVTAQQWKASQSCP